MKLKPFSLFLIATCILCCLHQNSFAQNAAPISGQRLAAIEQEMFRDSIREFIIIDLIMDNVMKIGENCIYRYDKDGVSYFNDKKLPDHLQKKYAARNKDFERLIGSGKTSFAITMGPVNTTDVLDPNSRLRKPASNPIKDIPRNQQNNDAIDKAEKEFLSQLVIENKLDTIKNYWLRLDATGLYINNKKQKGPLAEKFISQVKAIMHVSPIDTSFYFRHEGGGN